MKKDAFTQRVRLPAVQASSLKPQELALALAYEVEPFSGIPAVDAEVTWVEEADPDATVKVYSVTVKPKKRSGAIGDGGKWLKPIAIFGAIAVILAAADFASLRVKESRLKGEIAERKPLDSEVRELNAKAAALRAEARRAREEREGFARAQEKAAALRRAHGDLMATMASVCGGRTVVKSFTVDDGGAIVMRAIASTPEDAVKVMADLADAAKGWELSPGEIAADGESATASFSCSLIWKEAGE